LDRPQAAQTCHVDVHGDEVRPTFLKEMNASLAAVRLDNLETMIDENAAQNRSRDARIIDDQNGLAMRLDAHACGRSLKKRIVRALFANGRRRSMAGRDDGGVVEGEQLEAYVVEQVVVRRVLGHPATDASGEECVAGEDG